MFKDILLVTLIIKKNLCFLYFKCRAHQLINLNFFVLRALRGFQIRVFQLILGINSEGFIKKFPQLHKKF